MVRKRRRLRQGYSRLYQREWSSQGGYLVHYKGASSPLRQSRVRSLFMLTRHDMSRAQLMHNQKDPQGVVDAVEVSLKKVCCSVRSGRPESSSADGVTASSRLDSITPIFTSFTDPKEDLKFGLLVGKVVSWRRRRVWLSRLEFRELRSFRKDGKMD